jgi:hypothetical protein
MTKRTALFAAGIAIVAVLATASMHAFPMTRYNDLTFNRPFALPGITLPAGEYRFEVTNTAAHIVRVSNPATNQVYFMHFTTRVSRPHTLRADQIVTFGEAREGAPTPIRVWYPRGGGDGHQFVY